MMPGWFAVVILVADVIIAFFGRLYARQKVGQAMNAFVARVGCWWSDVYPTEEEAANAALEYGRQQGLQTTLYTIFRTGWCHATS